MLMLRKINQHRDNSFWYIAHGSMYNSSSVKTLSNPIGSCYFWPILQKSSQAGVKNKSAGLVTSYLSKEFAIQSRNLQTKRVIIY